MFALTNDEIASRCPAIFADTYSEARTNKYTHFNTINVIDALRGEGFEVTNAFAQKSRSTDANGGISHVRHCVRMSHVDYLNTLKPNDIRPEIVLVNSHNGSTSFRVMAGVFRIVCSNGLITMSDEIGESRIRHMGHTLDEVVESTLRFAALASKENFETIEAMKTKNLSDSQQRKFAREAAMIRFWGDEKKIENYENLLNSRRHDDNLEPTVWNIFNVLQENCIKGGQFVGGRQMREIKGIDNQIRVNRELWKSATDKMVISVA